MHLKNSSSIDNSKYSESIFFMAIILEKQCGASMVGVCILPFSPILYRESCKGNMYEQGKKLPAKVLKDVEKMALLFNKKL